MSFLLREKHDIPLHNTMERCWCLKTGDDCGHTTAEEREGVATVMRECRDDAKRDGYEIYIYETEADERAVQATGHSAHHV
jgi:hypothetical protein